MEVERSLVNVDFTKKKKHLLNLGKEENDSTLISVADKSKSISEDVAKAEFLKRMRKV